MRSLSEIKEENRIMAQQWKRRQYDFVLAQVSDLSKRDRHRLVAHIEKQLTANKKHEDQRHSRNNENHSRTRH